VNLQLWVYSGIEMAILRNLTWVFVTLGLAGLAVAQGPTEGGCPVFPLDNIWNTRIDRLPVSPSSSTWVSTSGPSSPLHPDFGSGTYNGEPIGIPYVTVPGTQTKYPATFTYQSESDPGPYAIPLNAPIEGGSSSTGDRHVIAVDTTNCILYEMWDAFPQSASWQGGSGAIFNLLSDALRPASWTSADAAGLPIFPGLVRYEEIAAGAINHAIRFTVPQTQQAYVWPARHYASSLTGAQYPPMGARFRLKSSFDISAFSATNQIILNALKRYGMILADNGSSWYISGAPDSRWDNNDLHALTSITGSNFEAVDATTLMIDPNSGETLQNQPTPVSLSPSSGSGTSQTFAASFSDGAGASDILAARVVFDSSLSGTSSCFLYYAAAPQALYLLSDSGAFQSPLTIGASGTLSNGQCSVNVGASSVVMSGDLLTLNLAISFAPAFAGVKNVYLEAQNATVLGPWSEAGTWTVAGPSAPSAVSVSPSSGSGSSQTFTATFLDAAGANDILAARVLINSALSGTAGCFLYYYGAGAKVLYLLSDAGALSSGVPIGTAGTLSNSQCSVNVGASSALLSGNTLTLTLAVTFTQGFAGARNIFLEAQNATVLGAWAELGTWTVPGSSTPPSPVSVTPSSGSGTSQTFAATFSDAGGAGSILAARVLINSSLSGANACFLYYYAGASVLYLLTDSGTFQAPISIGSSGTLSNSQCSVNVGASSAVLSGNTLTLNLALTFTPAFAGAKNVYLEAQSATALGGWGQLGTWSVP